MKVKVTKDYFLFLRQAKVGGRVRVHHEQRGRGESDKENDQNQNPWIGDLTCKQYPTKKDVKILISKMKWSPTLNWPRFNFMFLV